MMVLIEILHVVDYILEQVVVRNLCRQSLFHCYCVLSYALSPDKCCYGQSTVFKLPFARYDKSFVIFQSTKKLINSRSVWLLLFE